MCLGMTFFWPQPGRAQTLTRRTTRRRGRAARRPRSASRARPGRHDGRPGRARAESPRGYVRSPLALELGQQDRRAREQLSRTLSKHVLERVERDVLTARSWRWIGEVFAGQRI